MYPACFKSAAAVFFFGEGSSDERTPPLRVGLGDFRSLLAQILLVFGEQMAVEGHGAKLDFRE